MQGAPFSSVSLTITGEAAPVIETNIASGVTATMTGIGAFAANKCELVYLLSDQTDCTVVFTDGTQALTFNLTGRPCRRSRFVGGGTNPLTRGQLRARCTSMTVETSTRPTAWPTPWPPTSTPG